MVVSTVATGVFFAVSFGCSGMIATEPALVTIGDDTALAPARINGKWGYIDTSGSFVIPPQFSGAGNFSEDWPQFADTDYGVILINV